jgi:hypothetical protein
MKMLGRVFDASESCGVRYVSGHAYDKEPAEPFVEYDLGRYTRIRATENDCVWMLSFYQFRSFSPVV